MRKKLIDLILNTRGQACGFFRNLQFYAPNQKFFSLLGGL